MSLNDMRGNPVSAATPAALAHYEQATDLSLAFSGRSAEAAEAAVAADPGFVMGHCLKAGLGAIANEKTFEPQVRPAVEAAERLAGDANRRERAHIAALRAFLDGEWRKANAIYGELLIDHPRDSLALQIAHALDFYLGQSALLRDRIARALPQWSEQVPGYGYILGMHAFGLEEMGDYGRAESTGREAVGRNRGDVWAIHAVSHVMEMQGRARDGIDWLAGRSADWGAADNLFAIHNGWHLALFYLDLGEHDKVLALYDERIRAGNSTVGLDLVDAAAMLWRLHLRGVDVGARWNEIADAWQPSIDGGWYAFNDMHAMMAFVASGRERDADRLLAGMAKRAENGVTNAGLTREVGLPIARALRAFGRADYATAIGLLESVRLTAHRFGGSHAQRDVLHLTLTEAAIRGGSANYARAVVAERLALKPASPSNRRLAERARALTTAGSPMAPVIRSVELPGRVRLEYVEQGDPAGIPVVMLHGMTDSWHSFEPVLPHLAGSIRAFALTQRGHGDADRPGSGYRTRDFADDVAAFTDALGLGPVVVVGHSMGSTNAKRFAIDYPGRTRGLVLVGAFATYRNNPTLVEFWQSAVSTLTDPIDPDFAREFQESTLARRLSPAFLETVVRESLKVPARVWRAAFEGFLEDDFAAELGEIAAPTLVLWGDRDRFAPRTDQDALVAGIADSRLGVYEGTGHALHWEEPRRFAADLTAFVGELARRDADVASSRDKQARRTRALGAAA